MPVLNVIEDLDGHESSIDTKERTYVRTFLVTMDSDDDRALTARTASGIPQLGHSYQAGTEFDAFAFVNSVKANRVDKRVWQVVVTYSSVAPEENQQDPLTADPKYSWGSAQFSRPIDFDINDALLNSAGDPFDPAIEKEDSRDVLRVTRNEATYSPSIASTYKNKVNSGTFYGYPPGHAKVFDISADSFRHTDGNVYWTVNYEVHFSRDGFQPKVLDQGYRYINSQGDQEHITVKDKEGQEIPVSSPKNLDGNGGILPEGGDAVFLDFEIYESANFAGLNI